MLNIVSIKILGEYKETLLQEIDRKNGLIGEASSEIEELTKRRECLMAEVDSLKKSLSEIDSDLGVKPIG